MIDAVARMAAGCCAALPADRRGVQIRDDAPVARTLVSLSLHPCLCGSLWGDPKSRLVGVVVPRPVALALLNRVCAGCHAACAPMHCTCTLSASSAVSSLSGTKGRRMVAAGTDGGRTFYLSWAPFSHLFIDLPTIFLGLPVGPSGLLHDFSHAASRTMATVLPQKIRWPVAAGATGSICTVLPSGAIPMIRWPTRVKRTSDPGHSRLASAVLPRKVRCPKALPDQFVGV